MIYVCYVYLYTPPPLPKAAVGLAAFDGDIIVHILTAAWLVRFTD